MADNNTFQHPLVGRYAAKEMRERLGRQLGRGARGLTAGTFHAVCAKLLREFIAGLDIPAAAREELLALTPASYTGAARQLAEDV